MVGMKTNETNQPPPNDMSGHAVYHSETGVLLASAATPEQWLASRESDEGHILIDTAGNVVQPGTWAASLPGTMKVFVA